MNQPPYKITQTPIQGGAYCINHSFLIISAQNLKTSQQQILAQQILQQQQQQTQSTNSYFPPSHQF